jgi:hypothetical protein
MVYAIEAKKQGRENEMMRGEDVNAAPRRHTVKEMITKLNKAADRMEAGEISSDNDEPRTARISAEELRKERNREYQRQRRARIRSGEISARIREPKTKKLKPSQEK